MEREKVSIERGEELLKILKAALADLENAGGKKDLSDYRAYLHGQIYGLATALKMIYPGPGNLGEKAALALRQVITEHSCRCGGNDDSPEEGL